MKNVVVLFSASPVHTMSSNKEVERLDEKMVAVELGMGGAPRGWWVAKAILSLECIMPSCDVPGIHSDIQN